MAIDLIPLVGLNEVNDRFEKMLILAENGKEFNLSEIEKLFGVKPSAANKKYKLNPEMSDFDSMILYRRKKDGTTEAYGRRVIIQGFLKK